VTWVGRIRERRYAQAVAERAAAYAEESDSGARASLQLGLLNAEWTRVLRTVPHYARLAAAGTLPRSFASLDAFVRLVPPTTRHDVQASLADRTSSGAPPDFKRITGGSTSEPVQLPAWSSEQAFTRADTWWARGWYRITPGSRLFLLWGHSHLLGTGFPGWIRARRMEWSDRLLGYYRHSAYDMRPERLRDGARALIRFRPDYMIGYSVALARFAAANGSLRDELRSLGLRAVIGAAEAFPPGDAMRQLEDLFGCPVGMEYGSVETGLMGHSHPRSGYRVFWRSYLLDAERHGDVWRLKVTSLYPRAFPLIRYDIGDEVELAAGTPDTAIGLARIERVVGRCNDTVVLADGSVTHSEVFTHVVRPCSEIRAYQIVQRDGAIRIDYLAEAPLSQEAAAGVRERLRKIHPDLERIPLTRVPDLKRTIAGKTRMVVIE